MSYQESPINYADTRDWHQNCIPGERTSLTMSRQEVTASDFYCLTHWGAIAVYMHRITTSTEELEFIINPKRLARLKTYCGVKTKQNPSGIDNILVFFKHDKATGTSTPLGFAYFSDVLVCMEYYFGRHNPPTIYLSALIAAGKLRDLSEKPHLFPTTPPPTRRRK